MPAKCFYVTDTKCWGYKVNKSRHDPGPHGIYSLELEININQISFTVLITHIDKHLHLGLPGKDPVLQGDGTESGGMRKYHLSRNDKHK